MAPSPAQSLHPEPGERQSEEGTQASACVPGQVPAGWGRGYAVAMGELIFEVVQESDGGFVAECLTESVFSQCDSWDELRDNLREAVAAFYFDRERPAGIRLHLVRDEYLAVG